MYGTGDATPQAEACGYRRCAGRFAEWSAVVLNKTTAIRAEPLALPAHLIYPFDRVFSIKRGILTMTQSGECCKFLGQI
ncbi:MAG: hypothetical protein K2R98_17745, partial [Gemmataceae bacterium]|nr:hypothetical protein [Gemmataceae bacterium]